MSTTKRLYGPVPSGTQPPHLYPPYVSSRKRAPSKPLVLMPQTMSELTGPVFGRDALGPLDHDLTRAHDAEPLGERIIVTGRVLDEDGRPIRHTLVELWQANAAGRYAHAIDRHDAPLDPNFSGCGRTLTDEEGRYRFVTIKPGAYPWTNHQNAWRPAHIHFSLFGEAFLTRLVTQMYFSGRPAVAVRSRPARHSRRRRTRPARFDVRLGLDAARACAGVSVRHGAARPERDALGEMTPWDKR